MEINVKNLKGIRYHGNDIQELIVNGVSAWKKGNQVKEIKLGILETSGSMTVSPSGANLDTYDYGPMRDGRAGIKKINFEALPVDADNKGVRIVPVDVTNMTFYSGDWDDTPVVDFKDLKFLPDGTCENFHFMNFGTFDVWDGIAHFRIESLDGGAFKDIYIKGMYED